jgi:hypothetical protein
MSFLKKSALLLLVALLCTSCYYGVPADYYSAPYSYYPYPAPYYTSPGVGFYFDFPIGGRGYYGGGHHGGYRHHR